MKSWAATAAFAFGGLATIVEPVGIRLICVTIGLLAAIILGMAIQATPTTPED